MKREIIGLFMALAAVILPQFVHATANAVCPENMASYWMFDELAGNSFADTLGGIQARCHQTGGCPVVTEGRIGRGVSFDGIDDGIKAGYAPALNWGRDSSFTIEFWMRADGVSASSGSQVIVGRADASSGFLWWLGVQYGTGAAAFQLKDENGEGPSALAGVMDVRDGRWHHIAGVRDGAREITILYVDGRREDLQPASYAAGFRSSTAPLSMGWLSDSNGFHFAGSLDELAIHCRALSEGEIRQHFLDGAIGLRRGYCVDCSSKIRIMPLGDSITLGYYEGVPTFIGYRGELYSGLKSAGYNVDFVGSLRHGPGGSALDIDHEGHGGWASVHLLGGNAANPAAGKLSDWLQASQPDVVLLHIGTNDVTVGIQNAAYIGLILDEIYRFRPDASVVVARIVSRIDDAAKAQATTKFNNDVAALVGMRRAQGYQVFMVDQERALNYSVDMGDPIHPNTAGYLKMSHVWMQALTAFLPMCERENSPAIFSPYGGEIIPSGTEDYPLRWAGLSDAARFTVKYSLDSGTSWKLIDRDVISRSYLWDVPVLERNKSSCLLKVVAFDSAGRHLGTVKSAKPFAIEVVRVTSLSGSPPVTVKSGNTVQVRWQTNETVSPVERVFIKYTLNGGRTWRRAAVLNGNPGTYVWTVPQVSREKRKCRVKVILKDREKRTIGIDTSDGYFVTTP